MHLQKEKVRADAGLQELQRKNEEIEQLKTKLATLERSFGALKTNFSHQMTISEDRDQCNYLEIATLQESMQALLNKTNLQQEQSSKVYRQHSW